MASRKEVLRSSGVAPAQSPLLSEWGEPGYNEAGACQVVCRRTSVDGPSQAESSASEIVLWPRCGISMGLTLWTSTLHVRLWGREEEGR